MRDQTVAGPRTTPRRPRAAPAGAPPRDRAGELLLPARQFLDWFAELERAIDGQLRHQAKTAGRPMKAGRRSGAQARALEQIGWHGKLGRRRLEALRTGRCEERDGVAMFALADVAEALWQKDIALEELYPPEIYPWVADTTALPEAHFCATCSDEVLPIRDTDGQLTCAFCENPLTRPIVNAPRIGATPAPRATVRARRPRRTRLWLTRGQILREAAALLLENDHCVFATARALCERHPRRWPAGPRAIEGTITYALRRERLLLGNRRTIHADQRLRAEERARIERYLARPSRPPAYRGAFPAAVVFEAAWLYYYDQRDLRDVAQLLARRWPELASGAKKPLERRLADSFHRNGWATRTPLSEEVLAEAVWLYYYDQWGLERTAELLKRRWPWVSNASDHAFGKSIQRAFHQQGWKTRTQADGASLRAASGTCGRTTKKGQPCRNVPAPGSSICRMHQRERPQPLARDLVDSAPLIAWLGARAQERGSRQAAASLVGIQQTMFNKLLRTGGTTRPGQVTRRYIERLLTNALANDPHLLVPRFTDLYQLAEPAAPTTGVPAHAPSGPKPRRAASKRGRARASHAPTRALTGARGRR